MQKSILFPVFYVSLSISGLSIAIAAIDNTLTPAQTYASHKIAIISQMYEQDASVEGLSETPILIEYGTLELQDAFTLEQDYYDRTQMNCNVGFDILWDSQDPDYAQDKQITMTDTGLVKVSSHAGCRPTHLQYQGNVYSVSDTNLSEYPDLNEATNFGSAGGLCGINCHHYVMTYVPGYDLPDVDTLDPKSNNEQYQLTQTQRRLEREVRAAKRKMTVAQRFGSDGDVANARRLVSKRQANVRQFVMRHEDVLRRDYSRETNHVTAWIPKATPKLKMNLQYFTNGHVYKQGEILKALPKVSEAVYPQSKFVDYFLSPTHPVGQNKAEVFRNVLGYTQDNWTDLRDQIKRELPNTKARARGDEGHGPKFETIISITGPTGRTADVMVSWIIDADNDGELRLTTAHVMEEGRKKWN